MKAILEFTLPEEQSEFEAASSVHKYQQFLWSLENEIRSACKYESGLLKDLPPDAVEKLRDVFYELKAEAGVTENL
jgi:hypothetical protein